MKTGVGQDVSESDRTSPSWTEREPHTLRTGTGAGLTTGLGLSRSRTTSCITSVAQPARTRDSVSTASVLPDGPGIGWIHNELFRGGRVMRPCPCRQIFKTPSPQRGPNSSPHHEGAGPPLLPGGVGGLAKAAGRLGAAPQG
jgi:hypothetical protein